MNIRTIAFSGVAALAGLGLVGVGAHAQFTASTASTQTINAGTPAVALWASGATNTCTTQAIAVANPVTCNSITLPAGGPFGSTFDLPSDIGVVNTGNISVTLTSLLVTDINPTGLGSELGFCITGLGMSYNGQLNAFPDFNDAPPGDVFSGGSSLAAGAAGNYQADFYAGQASSVCGGSANADLTEGVVGQGDTVTLTVGYSG